MSICSCSISVDADYHRRLPPKTPEELRFQFQALCKSLDIDPAASDAIEKIGDPSDAPAETMAKIIETETNASWSTFRGCLDGSWLSDSPGPMEWQRSGGFAAKLKEKGLRSIVLGDLTEEWYLYSIAHGPIHSMDEVKVNLLRYYQPDFVEKAMKMYRTVPAGSPTEDFMRLFGEISSAAQVHTPVRILARDLTNAGFPVLRYEIAWTPEQVRPHGE